MANSQPYPQAGPSSHHHSTAPYGPADSPYQRQLQHYTPNYNPQGHIGQYGFGSHRPNTSYNEFIPQQRHFRKGHRHPRRYPHYHQQQQLHFYQSQPMFHPPHAVLDYFPSHELWTPPPFPPPPQHPAYVYQPPYPPAALSNPLSPSPYGEFSSPHTSITPSTSEPELPPSSVHSPDDYQENETVQSNEEAVEAPTVENPILNEPTVILPIWRNSRKGFALQLKRPRVPRALPVTISHTAKPPTSLIHFLDADETCLIHDRYVFYTSSIDDVTDNSTSPKEPIFVEHSLASTSTATPETSTAAETPQVGSPRSSVTSVSIVVKAAPDISEELLESQPESSTPQNIGNSESAIQPPTEPPSIQTDAATSLASAGSSSPSPSSRHATELTAQSPQPTKKSWASLFRSGGNDNLSVNGLPMSSIQGFSIPATSQETKAGPSTGQNLINLLTSPNTAPHEQLPNLRARGLINLGNMCFANTVLQVLTYCLPFRRLFSELEKHLNNKGSISTPLINATIEFMKEFHPIEPDNKPGDEQTEEEIHHYEPFIPTVVYQALKEKKRFDSMRGGQQEDAEEFLGFYLDTLEDELLSLLGNQPLKSATPEIVVNGAGDNEDGWQEVGRKNKTIATRIVQYFVFIRDVELFLTLLQHKSNESPISRIFGGRFRTTLKVPGSRESAMIDPWSRFQLDIQSDLVHTIEDALRYTTEQRTVQVASATRGQVDANQQTLIESLPPILILHLKRFLYDTSVNDVIKLTKKISFSPELIIPKDILSKSRRSQAFKYKLFGGILLSPDSLTFVLTYVNVVLNHHGNTATGGHYTLDVLHPDPHETGKDGWIRLDDDSVQDIILDDLASKDFGDDRTAYLLFYRRM